MVSTTQSLNRIAAISSTVPALSRRALPLEQFVFGAGIESSCLPHLQVDQYSWTQHDRFWREDLRLAREELGLNHLRYNFPWSRLEPQPGQFDWTYADERVEECDRLGLNLMLDVMHFGTPAWLAQAVGDPEFPEALERFTEAMVDRYRGSIRIWCPCNEPLVCALFSGDFGFWPPHGRKWRGYMPVLSRIVQGVSRSIRAIRRVMPEATVLMVDTAEHYKSRHESLSEEVNRRNLRRFAVMDLLTGRVDRHHPLFAWFSGYGISDLDLDWFHSHPQTPDVLGMDYYAHGDWQLDMINGSVRQKRADSPAGFYAVACEYYQRYGLPLMLTETSIEGETINRETWLDITLDHVRRLREEGIPMLGYVWWPLLDQLDWDGALTHRIGKIHQVGLFRLTRQADGTLSRAATSLVPLFREAVAAGEARVGKLAQIVEPASICGSPDAEQGPPIGEEYAVSMGDTPVTSPQSKSGNGKSNGNGNGNGHGTATAGIQRADPAPGLAAEAQAVHPEIAARSITTGEPSDRLSTDRYGIVVFSHLRWGFVWQRPQQFLSRFARKHNVLFVEEPMFDLSEQEEPRLEMHRVMPNIVVACPHMPPSYNRNPKLPDLLREFAHQAIKDINDDGQFDRPLLWYYSPMDSAWSLGEFQNRGIVYDSMDELSQFTGAPKALIANEARLLESADIVFAGGYELWLKKKQMHDNVHFFGCGVEYDHFAQAQSEDTSIPPDIDFIARPILGWFGVVDERVDYGLVGQVARARPDWSIAMVGPVVKVDPNLVPHSPNLFWLGQRDYQVLPNYCRAFDVCIMPFALNASTQYINPTKALEYFATGKPVVSTPVKDVVRQYSDLIAIAKNNVDEFVQAVQRVLDDPDEDRIRRGIEKAQASSWENTVDTMQRLIREAVGNEDRRSRKAPRPLPSDDAGVLAYQYQPTQGS